MPQFPYAKLLTKARKDPLGAPSVNQLQLNALALDELARVEHFADGQHNALEIPWVLGHMDDGATPTGYLFDTAFGGGTLARPATGRYTCSVVSGVIPSDVDGNLLYSAMANVSDSAIESKPHTITVEAVSATSFQYRVRQLSSALGAGDTWADQNRDIDIGIHSLAKAADTSLLGAYREKRRREKLTEVATDWNALVQNQGIIRKASLLEHTSAGEHSLNRIAKGVGWFDYSAGYSMADERNLTSVTGLSTGVVEVVMDANFTSTNNMACFPEVQPATPEELVIINGRGFATGAGTSAFRFYIYAFDGTNWARADRSFFASMFGVIA